MGQTKVTIGVNNLFDRAPPTIYGAPTSNSDSMLYDFVGRFGYIRIAHLFD
jgi:iron complex outermembrane receptor protein